MVNSAMVQKAAILLYGGNDEKRQMWTRSGESCWVMATNMLCHQRPSLLTVGSCLSHSHVNVWWKRREAPKVDEKH